MKIKTEVIEVIKEIECEDNKCRITTQLDRKLYADVAKLLRNMGGKWVTSKKCTVFPEGTDLKATFDKIIETGEFISLQKEFQFFPTPDELAKKLIEIAEISENDICLEPSAGRGNIAKYMTGCDCIELNKDNRKHLQNNGFNVIHDDFMTFEPKKKYDVICMNPPFCKGQDAQHVIKAIEIAEKTVVAITSASVLFRQDNIYNELRQLVNFYNGSITELPEGSFKESGTNVNTCLVIVKKKGK